MASAGVNLSGPAAAARLAAVFKRPGGFGELSEEEAARLAMAGVDVHEPVGAVLCLISPEILLERRVHLHRLNLPHDDSTILAP